MKTQARVLGELFESRGISLTRAEKLEYLATIYGVKDYNILAPLAKSLPDDVQALLDHKFFSEDHLRLNAQPKELVLGLLAKDDCSPVELSKRLYQLLSELSGTEIGNPVHELRDFEISHADVAGDTSFENECRIRTLTGFSIAYPGYGLDSEIDYVRVLDPSGREIIHWSIDEFIEDPAAVLSAMLGAVDRGHAYNQPCTISQTRPKTSVVDERELPIGIEMLFRGSCAQYVDFDLYVNKPDGPTDSSEYDLHIFIDKSDKRLGVGGVRYSDSVDQDYQDLEITEDIKAHLTRALESKEAQAYLLLQMTQILRSRGIEIPGLVLNASSLKECFATYGIELK